MFIMDRSIMADGETSAEEKRRWTGPPEAQELEETKRRRTGPPEAQELEERLDSLRDKIAAASLVAGSRFGEEQRRSLLQEWLRLASAKLDLDLSGISEFDLSAEALPWLMPPEEADKRTTHTRQEAQELEERMTCLRLLFEDAADDRILARRELGAAADEFLLRLTTRQQALTREYSRLANLKRPLDLSGMTEADRAAEAERLREEKLQKARQLQDQGDMSGARGRIPQQYLLCRQHLHLRPHRGVARWSDEIYQQTLARQDVCELCVDKHPICQDCMLGYRLPHPSLWHRCCQGLHRLQVCLPLPPR